MGQIKVGGIIGTVGADIQAVPRIPPSSKRQSVRTPPEDSSMPDTTRMVKVDVISQGELERLLSLYNLHGEMVLDVRRRIEAGAEIEGGNFSATSDGP